MAEDSASVSFAVGPRSGTLKVSIDSQTQDVVLNIAGQSQEAGVTGVVWGIAGVDLSVGRIVLPSQGGNYLDLEHFQNLAIQ